MISFLIPTLPKNKDFLTLCVNSIIENTINDLEFEILIGENGEGTSYPQGQCKAVNRIARQAKGEWLFIANDDMYFPKGWNKFLTFPSACLSTNVNWCSAPVEGLSFVDLNAGTELDFDKKKVDDFMKNHNDKSVVNGFNFPLIIKKDLWDFIEGYDENYDPWGSNSDSDLEYKVKLVGVQPKKLNGVFVYHFCSKSDMYSHQDFMQKNYDYFENKWGFQRVDTPYIQRAEFEIPMDKLKYKPNFKK